MGVDNLRQFEVQLQRAVEEVPEAIFDAQIAATKAAEGTMREATPRGPTGRAKASVKSGATRRNTARGIKPLGTARPFGVTHAYSDLFYYRFLNDGTVHMAGRHMVERAAIRASDVLEAELR